jgi:hypothetical protein
MINLAEVKVDLKTQITTITKIIILIIITSKIIITILTKMVSKTQITKQNKIEINLTEEDQKIILNLTINKINLLKII